MRKLFLFPLAIILIIIFHTWFLSGNISGFDHPYLYPERIKDFTVLPFAWDGALGNGLGQNIIPLLWVDTYLVFILDIFAKTLHLPWEIIQRVGWFFPYIILAIVVPYYFLHSLGFITKRMVAYLAGSIIFSLNTYILMILAGGQMNIALAYAISPLVLLRFIKPLEEKAPSKRLLTRQSIISGLFFALAVILDMRLALLVLVAGLFYFIISLVNSFSQIKNYVLQFFWVYMLPTLIALLLHIYWILPLVLSHQNPIEDSGSAYSSTSAVSFFSFAKLENTISLLHPNWPENIFGMVSFMKPEFLLLPILAYLSLLFVNNKKNEQRTRVFILYFSLLGLLGSFLAKGANDPLGGLYLWAFVHIPGFSLFRDPSKFYLYTGISYLVLIPFCLISLYDWITVKIKQKRLNFYKLLSKYIPSLLLLFTILYFLFLIRPALLSQLNGTLQSNTIPNDYSKLEYYLAGRKDFSRTLWVPLRQRYGFYDINHPAVNAQDLFQIYNQRDLLKKLADTKTEKYLQDASIKYIIVPLDVEKEIYLQDRKYSEQAYQNTIRAVKEITWLKQVNQFKHLIVFEIATPKDHFWIVDRQVKMQYKYFSPTEYKVAIQNAKIGDKLIFTERYDPNWTAGPNASQAYGNLFNSFLLTRSGNFELTIHYKLQYWVFIGEMLSLSVLIISVFSLLLL